MNASKQCSKTETDFHFFLTQVFYKSRTDLSHLEARGQAMDLEEEVYNYIWQYVTENEALPSQQAVGEALGLTIREVAAAIAALRAEGRIEQRGVLPHANQHPGSPRKCVTCEWRLLAVGQGSAHDGDCQARSWRGRRLRAKTAFKGERIRLAGFAPASAASSLRFVPPEDIAILTREWRKPLNVMLDGEGGCG